MTRWKASGIHLLICGMIAFTVVAVMLFVWYPEPYFDALGGKHLLLVLIAVDITLGPLITLIIYNQNKKNLKFDLSVVAFVQIAALAYGISVLFEARPVYLVFAVDRFEVVTASELDTDSLDKVSREKFGSLSLIGPKLVTALLPLDTEERQKILFSALGGGPDLAAMPQYYVPYDDSKKIVVNKIQRLDKLSEVRKNFKKSIMEYAQQQGLDQSLVGFLPVRARDKFITAIMNRESAEIISLVDTDPWG